MSALVALLFFAVPLLAGIGTHMIRPEGRWLKLLLSASGAFLLGVVFLHMLPDLYVEDGSAMGFWLLAGFMLQVLLEPVSKGIEHGHFHAGAGTLPVATLMGLCLHSFLEGIPFADARVVGHLPFVAGVVLHKVPMAIALAAILLRSAWSRPRAWLGLVIFALAAPMGIVAGVRLEAFFGGGLMRGMLALAIGMLLHIGTTIIFESAPGHRVDRGRLLAVIAGLGSSLVLALAH